jgi:cysteine desulfurase
MEKLQRGQDGQYHNLRQKVNVPGIGGLKEFVVLLKNTEWKKESGLRDEKLESVISNCQVNGSMTHRLQGNLHMSIAGVTSEELVLMELSSNFAIPSGSACTSSQTGPSSPPSKKWTL